MYHFRLLCEGAFPIEMLTREKCWPRNAGSAQILEDSIKHPLKYKRYFMFMASNKRPRKGKWPADKALLLDVQEKESKKRKPSPKRRQSPRKK
jgi:hypothetical protein